MLPHYWKDTCLLSPPRGPLRLDFYSTDLTICIMTEAAPKPIFGTGDSRDGGRVRASAAKAETCRAAWRHGWSRALPVLARPQRIAAV